MSDYYIRTPDNQSSRGPFDGSKLQTLAEAGQITENTLYYDEEKEEWIPIALNEALKKVVFPERDRLHLRVNEKEDAAKQDDEANAESQLDVEIMLAAAEGTTRETKHLKKRAKSFDKAAEIATTGIGLMFLGSATWLIYPHYQLIVNFISEDTYAPILNYPFLLMGIFDLVMALFLFLAITETYSILRGRAMITSGFGIYVGWVLGDPSFMLAAVLGGIGIFVATIAQTYTTMLVAILCGVMGNAYLAYLSLTGRFGNFFELANLNIIAPK